MKWITFLLLTLLTNAVRSQSNEPNPETGVAMGLSGGYSNKNCMIGTFSIGAMLQTRYHVSMNLTILSQMDRVDIPSIGEARVGRFFSTYELYGGMAYHLAGSDNKISSNPNTGFRPAFGVIKHFTSSPWTIGAGMSGKVFSLQLGLFAVR
jgi:hypothetical protein